MPRSQRTFIIAEAGVNHNGSLDLAMRLVQCAKEAGADAVKFQSFRANELISRHAPKAEYQSQRTAENESQLEMVRKLELDADAHRHLARYCAERGILFLSTPFDSSSLAMLVEEFSMPLVKVASGEITNAPFLLRIARTGKPIILSTGMSTLNEVEAALGVIAHGYLNPDQRAGEDQFRAAYASKAGRAMLTDRVTLLHCTTEYPAPFNDINLRAMRTMSEHFCLPVGLSDHSVGISIPIAATALGAVMIEKHFTLDRNMSGPDHAASLEPSELTAMVKGIREVESALGDGLKVPRAAEIKNLPVARRSLVATIPIVTGELFSEENLAAKRPGTGMSPFAYWDVLGRRAARDVDADEMIDVKALEP